MVFKELLLEALADSAIEAGVPMETIREISALYMDDPPELKEYDDDYTRLLLYVVRVEGKILRFTFKDGTEVVRKIEK